MSIPDRKLALLEGERVLNVYDVAIGKPATPSPHGEFKIVSRHQSSLMWDVDYYKQLSPFLFSGVPFHTGSTFAKTGGIVSLKSPLK